jgi:glutamyl-tRNA reductase
VEWYARLDGEAERRLVAALLPPGGRMLTGAAAVHHAIAVATGRDSVVIGEDQVLHQLRQALAAARAARELDPILERLFATALRTGRVARSWRGGPVRSLADVAVATIEAAVGGVAGREVLVVGAGNMGRLAAHAAAAAGAAVAVANRSPSRAADVARATGGRVMDLDPGRGAHRFAGVIVALSGPWQIGAETIEALAGGSTAVVDLSVPSAVQEGLRISLGDRLTTADDVARRHDLPASDTDRTAARLDALIERTATEFLAWLEQADRRAAARALVERVERERRAELAELWRRLPDLDPGERATIEAMSRHLAERLLRDPLERLGTDSDGRHERAVRELWAL